VRVFLGRGDGSFATGTTLPTGAGATAIAAADLDLDGKIDLAVTLGASNQVVTFLGDGSGGFTAGPVSTVGLQPGPIAIGLFDADPFPDVAVGNRNGSTISIAVNDGTGRFGSEIQLDPGVVPEALAAGDFDGDGRLDVAVVGATATNTGALVIARGDGAGGFFDAPFYEVAEHLRTLAVGDVNEDGLLDVVAAGIDENATLQPFAVIFVGVGSGSFSISGQRVGNDPRAARLADLDSDGHLDLVLANRGSSDVSAILGDGTGAFDRGMYQFATGVRPISISVADFDRSGAPDLAVVNRTGRSVSIVRNRG
jgi:VCBS repeat protein